MGRQAHLTRLALGRSPFGDPLRDENGDLFLGPHAHDNAAKDYIQRFDEKGRPINRDTEAANRKLHRAQNEVLRVAGVVRKKEDPPISKLTETISENSKANLVLAEHLNGVLYHEFFGHCATLCSTWWLHTMRRRVYVSSSWLEVSVLTL